MGNPLDESTFLGPLITEHDAKRVEQWVNNSSGKVIVGGKRDGALYRKYLLMMIILYTYPYSNHTEATILENVNKNSELGRKEVFG
jgi:acyl-CoA reductase-like NAD-dependent aldehyde dehydrogenase